MSVTAVPIPPVKTGYKVWLWLGIIVAVLAAVLLAWQGTAKVIAAKGTDAQFLAWNQSQAGVAQTASGLQYQVLKAGEGPFATDEDVAIVDVTGRLRDGSVSFQTPRPVPLTAKNPGNPPGLTEALRIMQKGGKYRLWLTPALLRPVGAPAPTGPDAGKLQIFDIGVADLMSFSAFQQQMQMMQMMQQQGGGAPAGAEPAEPGAPPAHP